MQTCSLTGTHAASRGWTRRKQDGHRSHASRTDSSFGGGGGRRAVPARQCVPVRAHRASWRARRSRASGTRLPASIGPQASSQASTDETMLLRCCCVAVLLCCCAAVLAAVRDGWAQPPRCRPGRPVGPVSTDCCNRLCCRIHSNTMYSTVNGWPSLAAEESVRP